MHDGKAVRGLLSAVYGEAGWRVPEMLDAYGAAGDTYFDAVSRVRTPSWSRGPVVLLGDAASCITLFGEGSSAAISGAWRLAQVLRDSPGHVAQALRRYESTHRAEVWTAFRARRRAHPGSEVGARHSGPQPAAAAGWSAEPGMTATVSS